MRPIDRLRQGRKNDSTGRVFNFGGSGGSWELPPFWTGEAVRDAQEIDQHFEGYISGAYKANGIVFTCILIRLLTFSEVRFQFQPLAASGTDDLWGDSNALALLENPWPNGTTGELLARMEQDASLAGNFYATKITDQDGTRIRRLRPDWVTIVTGSRSQASSGDSINPFALDARVVGYLYEPKAGLNRPDPVLLLPADVVHWSPIPDPEAQWRGMSWLTPIVNEIKGDNATTKHKLKYFEHGTTGGIAITYDKDSSPEKVQRFAEMWKAQHSGTDSAYKTFHLGGGADAKVLGADLKQLDFKVTQGAGESRIAAAAGVGAVIAQFSEGLAGSSLNAGNFSAARRRFADITVRPNWRTAAASLSKFGNVPAGNRLCYDPRGVSFLQEDEKDGADIQAAQATTIRTLVDGGFNADEVVKAVTSGDLRALAGQHSGMFSAQLQEPGSDQGGTAKSLSLVEMVQKIYLGVGSVLTVEEARAILNSAGAGLTGPGPNPEG